MLPILKKLSDFCLYTKKSKDSFAKYYQKKQRKTKKGLLIWAWAI